MARELVLERRMSRADDSCLRVVPAAQGVVEVVSFHQMSAGEVALGEDVGTHVGFI